MRNEIKREIERVARKRLRLAAGIKAKEDEYQQKFKKRTGLQPKQPSKKSSSTTPWYFDPILALKNANRLATIVWRDVLAKRYEPVTAINYLVPKPDGRKRSVMSFSIVDTAVANVLLRRTRERNKKRLSPSSFAYHPDKNVFDAVLALKEFVHDGKLFSIQIDFQDYFDRIPSQYLRDKLNDREVLSLTPHERHIFEKFLNHSFSSAPIYPGKPTRRTSGTPQGSSASLLLANLANHDLDMKIASEAGRFARFADDVVALCSTYEQAQRIERCFHIHCEESGLVINERKSKGTAIVSSRVHELTTIKSFDYLGYRFTANKLTTTEKFERKMKDRVSRLVNIYLLDYLKLGHNASRCSRSPAYDWDLLGLIYELRQIFYGGFSEQQVQGFLYEKGRFKKMRGLMGFYCLLEDASSLRRLDGWTASIVRRAMVRRRSILTSKYGSDCPTPSNKALITGGWLDKSTWNTKGSSQSQIGVEAGLPSLVRGWRAARKHYFTYGLEDVMAPNYGRYFDDLPVVGY